MSDEGEKEFAASRQRLDEARKKGEIPRSTDLTWAGACAGLVLAATLSGPGLRKAGGILQTVIAQADRMAPMMRDGAAPVLSDVVGALLGALAPLFALPLLGAVLALGLQRAFLFTPSRLAPKLDRISPLAAAKNRFGRQGLSEFGKSLAKMLVVGVVLTLFLKARLPTLLITIETDPGIGVALLLRMILHFLGVVLVIALAFGAADYLWQRHEHGRRNRMSRQEMMDEHKTAEGDPHMKAQRRQRGMDMAMNQMLADVPKADVVLVNPTHYAVALAWDRASGRAPVCVAKGTDAIAARIREAAATAGVPIHRDPPTARVLHAALAIGDEIHPDHYRAVAAAIRFAETLRRRAKDRG
ncbi:flagellar biosynthesis protein FlhB [Falsirhodobacter algicola]|uniref:Flagellar type III secretion system protein FlhB n=1 Tax=Falsirhodobacter algicola TaxID=2692330 RepID=A0A8J8MSJ8_9RHOB|nr:flagellar type III secretion system protein FlhB [Falsirhodobacter algicola]QUS35926.1 flagellar type III secretion system protein FlhB [Falsirhodobacter algicola]